MSATSKYAVSNYHRMAPRLLFMRQ